MSVRYEFDGKRSAKRSNRARVGNAEKANSVLNG